MARQKPPSKAGAFWRAINVREDLAHGSAQGFVLKRSAKRNAKSFAPHGASLVMARRNEKARQNRIQLLFHNRKQKIVSKTKVLKRKRQKIHLSKHRIPICVARHKETRQYHSRMTTRRDPCSSEALPRNAKSFAPLRGKPPYTSIGYADGRSAMKKRHAVKARRL